MTAFATTVPRFTREPVRRTGMPLMLPATRRPRRAGRLEISCAGFVSSRPQTMARRAR